MSWHVAGIIVRRQEGNSTALLNDVVGDRSKEEFNLSLEELLSDGQHLAIAVDSEWMVILDPFMFLDLENAQGDGLWPMWLEARLQSNRASGITFLLEGTSATNGYAIYESGKRKRCFLIQDGQPLIELGTASAQEYEAWQEVESEDYEQFILRLTEKITIPFAQIAELTFDVYK